MYRDKNVTKKQTNRKFIFYNYNLCRHKFVHKTHYSAKYVNFAQFQKHYKSKTTFSVSNKKQIKLIFTNKCCDMMYHHPLQLTAIFFLLLSMPFSLQVSKFLRIYRCSSISTKMKLAPDLADTRRRFNVLTLQQRPSNVVLTSYPGWGSASDSNFDPV